ncbi:MAG TPA: hypothetical protein GXZ60_12680 [Intrasporangiaceae bacterium]|nr:hypothetical protein [Intrasporangiaceae bacterium]
MTATIRVDLGDHAAELKGQPIIVNGVELGVTDGQVTDVVTERGWSIIVIGHGWDQTGPARFHAYKDDLIQVYAERFSDGRVPGGGLLGGRYYLRVEHPRPLPPDPAG